MSPWLALLLPALSLQRAQRALDPALARTLALAIVEGPVQRQVVAGCNEAARNAGVERGMKLAAAQALARGLVAIARDPEREAGALRELGCWAGQFSPHVVVRPDGADALVLLETGSSERLFGGRQALRGRILRSLRALGYTSHEASAPTPRGALWLARARARGIAAPGEVGVQALRAALSPLPLSVPGWDERAVATLRALGLATVGEAMALPRDSFSRRLGPELVGDLDRALGACPDPMPAFLVPERFHAGLELPADIVHGEQLAFAVRRLLRSLEGFLRARNVAATHLLLRVHHSPRRTQPVPPTPVELSLAVPERDGERLARLFDERLARTTLPEPAIALDLLVERLEAFAPRNASFLPPAPEAAGRDEGGLRLAEMLCARLGEGRVFGLRLLDDHRPEHAYRVARLGEPAPSPPPLSRGERGDPSLPPLPPGEGPGVRAGGTRPLLLLPSPRPLSRDHEPLSLLAGPERIEAGWWAIPPGDADTAQDTAQDAAYGAAPGVQRDYFVARNGRGQVLWIYRELAPPRRWFLHGFFA